MNIASALLWTSLDLYDLQLYLVPFGFTLIGLVELLKVEMPERAHGTALHRRTDDLGVAGL